MNSFKIKNKQIETEIAIAILEMHDCNNSIKPININNDYLIYPWSTGIENDMIWVDTSPKNIIDFYIKTTGRKELLS